MVRRLFCLYIEPKCMLSNFLRYCLAPILSILHSAMVFFSLCLPPLLLPVAMPWKWMILGNRNSSCTPSHMVYACRFIPMRRYCTPLHTVVAYHSPLFATSSDPTQTHTTRRILHSFFICLFAGSFLFFGYLLLDFYARILFKIETWREIHWKISNNSLWIVYTGCSRWWISE